MCGIFGMIGRTAPVPAEVLERATQSLAHRGPDDSGTVILRDASREPDRDRFGKSTSRNPRSVSARASADERSRNRQLDRLQRRGLQLPRSARQTGAKGLSFRSNSDTEVILKAYGQWGEKCLHEFRGMFAFAIWDAQRRRLFVARDPMGIKPLYFYQSDQYFIFSSEVRTLLGTGLVPRVIDCAGLINYLTFGSLYDPNTLVEGVEALPPGCYLTWADGRLEQEQYWDLVGTNPGEACDKAHNDGQRRDELETQIAKMLDESVRMQLVSDVPVGVFLSGGIDSSSLVGILSRNGVCPSTFSIVFREADYSEAEYSRAVAQHFHTDHHEITVTQSDFFAAIDPAIHAMDLPTIDGINTYFVSERTRAAGVKVVLSGLGGDEMFAGYSSFRRPCRGWNDLPVRGQHVPEALREPLANMFAALAPSNDQNRKLTALGRNSGGIVHPYFLSRMLFTPEQQNELLPQMKTNSADFAACEEALDRKPAAAPKAWTRSIAFPISRRAVICSTHCCGTRTS